MTDTLATVRKEILEDAKAEIDAKADYARELRDRYEIDSDGWKFWDAEIDRLQLQKDDLPQTLFSDRADEIEPTAEEQQALERRLAQLDCTYPSPIISGGDIVEIIPQAGDGEVPFLG